MANTNTLIPVQINDDTKSLHAIGDYIMSYQPYQNAFLNALVNRIARTIVTSKMWQNPWARFKKGMIEFGETVEEVFVNIAKPYSFDPEMAEKELYKREVPDVRAAFHTMNWQKLYPVTVSQEQLKVAFLGWDGITDLIAKITESLYTSLALDEFLTMKYMIAREIVNGGFAVQTHDAIATKPTDAIKKYRTVTNDLTFLKSKFNRAHVRNSTPVNEQVIIIPNATEATLGVDVLANAYNLSQVDYIGNRIAIDSWEFDDDDTERLGELFANDDAYKPFTDDEKNELAKVSALKCDSSLFMIFDNLEQFTETYNGRGLYWNYFLHAWKTFSVSPYANAVVFTESASSVTGVTVSPSTATLSAGASMMFSADVAGSGIFDKSVTWSVDGDAVASGTHIDPQSGRLVVARNQDAGSLTVTAETVNGTKGTATVTVS